MKKRRHFSLIEALQNPAIYDHPVQGFRVVETHISWVLLTGHYAYKIKKPVNLGFLDFSTLDKRRHYCEEELRLNRRLCPDLRRVWVRPGRRSFPLMCAVSWSVRRSGMRSSQYTERRK